MQSEYEGSILKSLKSNDTPFLNTYFQNGLDPNYRLVEMEEYSLLHVAVGLCKASLVQFLLEKGADPNFYSPDYMTPVHLSSLWDFDVLLQLLLKFGGDPYICDLLGKTAFDIALEGCSHKCLAVLNGYAQTDIPSSSKKYSSVDLPRWLPVRGIQGITPLPPESVDLFDSSLDSTLKSSCVSSVETTSSTNSGSLLNNAFLTCSSGSSNSGDERDVTSDLYYSLLSEGSINGLPVVDYLYSDPEEGIAFVERRLPGSRSITPSSDDSSYTSVYSALTNHIQELGICQPGTATFKTTDLHLQRAAGSKNSLENGALSDTDISWYSSKSKLNCASRIPSDLDKLSNIEIREKLLKLGKNPGPVTGDTRNVYLNWLVRLQGESVLEKKCGQESTLSNSEIREELLKQGRDPGPITNGVRGIYLKLLCKLNAGIRRHGNNVPAVTNTSVLSGYPQTLRALTCQPESEWINQFLSMEEELRSDFDKPTASWREGCFKSAFNYLLLDPRITLNLPNRVLGSCQQFETFIRAVFYVGKGSRSRPLSHLYEAVRFKDNKNSVDCSKIKRIRDIWKGGYGVVSLYCFQNVIPVEAYTREACMIFSLGLDNITNIRKGELYGKASQWPLKKKCQFGAFLLYRALQVFLNEGERQIRPTDLKMR